MNSVKAVVFDGINNVSVSEVGIPDCRPDQIGVKSICTYVSPGTELRVLAGCYGAKDNFPLIPGYSCVGLVTEVGSNIKTFRTGDLVSCRSGGEFIGATAFWGGQASYHIYNLDSPVLLPQNAEPFDYVIAEVAAISLRGIEAANPQAGENALIIGQGIIGAFSEEFSRLRGCKTVVCDLNEARLKSALGRGAAAAINLSEPNAEEYIRSLGFGAEGGFDIVVESSGSIPGLELAGRMVRHTPSPKNRDSYGLESFAKNWPRLVLQANYIDNITHSDPRALIRSEGVVILMPNDRGIDNRKKVIEYIRCGKIRVEEYTADVFSPEQMPQVYEKLQRKELFSAVCMW